MGTQSIFNTSITEMYLIQFETNCPKSKSFVGAKAITSLLTILYLITITPLNDSSDIKYSCYSIPSYLTAQYNSLYPKLDKAATLLLPS